MPIQSITDSQAWSEFLKATQVARTRNAAFTPNASGVEPGKLNGTRKTAQTPVAQPVSRTYVPSAPIQQKAVLGTKFDAYA
jgi:hypothetical protein